MARLGDVCSKATSAIAQKDLEGRFGEFPIYGASGFITTVDFYHQEKPYIAVVKDGAGVGRIMKLPAKSSVIGTMQYIIPNENVDIGYLAYAMENMNLAKYYTGATIPHIYFKDYQKEELSLPPLDKQRRIAAVLDKVSDLIAKRRAQLDKLDLLVKARFVEMFGDPLRNTKGWPYLELSKVCKAILGGGTPSKSHPEYFMGVVPWVSPKDMKQMIISDSIDHITEEAIANSTTNLVPINSVLMVIRSGILKHTLPVAINNVPVTINQDMKAFVPDSNILAEFLLYYFKAIEPDVLTGVRGVTADNIDFKAFQKRKTIVPPFDMQKEYASFVRYVDGSKLTIQQSLDKLEILKKALMQKYFG